MRKASLCRHFENNVFELVKEKKIEYPVYLSTGQEYIPSSISEIVKLKKISPLLFGQHRCHSLYLSFGGNIVKLINELLGNKNGCTYGMGGSLSIHSEKINMFGHDGFMGSNVCIGVGASFSSRKPILGSKSFLLMSRFLFTLRFWLPSCQAIISCVYIIL